MSVAVEHNAVKVNDETYWIISQSREIILNLFSDIFLSFPKWKELDLKELFTKKIIV